MTDLRSAASDLLEVLERENEALRRFDLQTATAVLPDKRAALAAFERVNTEPRNSRFAIDTIRATMAALRETSIENKILLERAMRAQQHIIALLARAAQKATQSTRYGSHGSYAGSSAARSFAFNARA